MFLYPFSKATIHKLWLDQHVVCGSERECGSISSGYSGIEADMILQAEKGSKSTRIQQSGTAQGLQSMKKFGAWP